MTEQQIIFLILISITLAIGVITALLAVFLLIKISKKNNEKSDFKVMITDLKESIEKSLRLESENIQNGITRAVDPIITTQKNAQDSLKENLNDFAGKQAKDNEKFEIATLDRLELLKKEFSQTYAQNRSDNLNNYTQIRDILDRKFESIEHKVNDNLTSLRRENEEKLNQMRETVDEKLQNVLDKRIAESFKVINAQLENVHKGLGEMSALSNGVNNLNRVLNNVKTRGSWGEVALENMLDQILTQEQYSKQVCISGKNSVDFVINLPGKDKDCVFLPIDAKFPLSDYDKLVDASETGDKIAYDDARKALINRVKAEAKDIGSKYVKPPKTTNFAIMYLPNEGLYAEVVRCPGLADELQNKFRIIVSGPTTLSALLNSLQIGFKTLAIQERSTEVWQALNKFKSEFKIFTESITKIRKKAGEMVSSIDESVKRTEKIERTLNKITENTKNLQLDTESDAIEAIVEPLTDN